MFSRISKYWELINVLSQRLGGHKKGQRRTGRGGTGRHQEKKYGRDQNHTGEVGGSAHPLGRPWGLLGSGDVMFRVPTKGAQWLVYNMDEHIVRWAEDSCFSCLKNSQSSFLPQASCSLYICQTLHRTPWLRRINTVIRTPKKIFHSLRGQSFQVLTICRSDLVVGVPCGVDYRWGVDRAASLSQAFTEPPGTRCCVRCQALTIFQVCPRHFT